MALIHCTECRHDVSTRAHACPNCGCPVELILQDLAEKAAANAANDEVLELLDIPSPDRVLLHCRVCDSDCEIDSTAFKSVGPGCCELAQDLPCPSCGAVHSTGKLIFKKGIPSGSSAAVVSCPHCGSTDYDVVNAGPSIGAALSSARSASISSAVRQKSNTSRFSRIHASWTDFGMTVTPSCIVRRSRTYAGDLPYFAAISRTTGSTNISFAFPCPSGA